MAASLLVVAAMLAICRAAPFNNTTVALALMLGVLFISAALGLAEALAASMMAALGFNYFFLPPVGALTIHDPQDLATFFGFLVTAVTASQLSAHARRRAADADARRAEIERLYALVQAMLLSDSAHKTASEFVHNVVRIFGCAAAAFYDKPRGKCSARARRAPPSPMPSCTPKSKLPMWR